MESIIFNYIGYALIFCAALCVVTPLVVHIVSLIVGAVWKIIDEGDSVAPDLLKKVMPFLFSNGVMRLTSGRWVVYKGCGDFYERSGRGTWSSEYVDQYCSFDSEGEAEARSIDLNVRNINFNPALALTGVLGLAGLGFVFTPTITMYLLSAALCVISLRWSRRGYKKVKKLKNALDEHSKNKDAHK